MTENVLILDYGSQYTQLIARRVREQRVYCEIAPFDLSPEEIVERAPAAIILSGGPASVTEEDAPALSPEVLALGVPVLGICYGLQVLTRTLGGRVEPSSRREYGRAEIEIVESGALFSRIDASTAQVWMSHGDHVAELAPGFRVLARTGDGVVAAVANPERRFWGVQFHPEVNHTPQGGEMLQAFLFDVAGLKGDWRFVFRAGEDMPRVSGTNFCAQAAEIVHVTFATLS